MRFTRTVITALALGFLLGLAGCEEEGPAEKAGERIDEAAEKAGDEMEEAGDEIEEAAEKAEEEMEDDGG